MKPNTLHVLLANLIGLLILAGCEATKEIGVMKELKFKSCEIKVLDDKLAISYEILNDGRAPIVLGNVLFKTDVEGSIAVEKDYAYVYRVKEDAVRIAKFFPPLLEEMLTEEIRPYVTVLGPGETFAETFSLPLPLLLEDPYLDNDLEQPSKVANVEFVVGYYPLAGDVEIIESELNGTSLKKVVGVPMFGKEQLMTVSNAGLEIIVGSSN